MRYTESEVVEWILIEMGLFGNRPQHQPEFSEDNKTGTAIYRPERAMLPKPWEIPRLEHQVNKKRDNPKNIVIVDPELYAAIDAREPGMFEIYDHTFMTARALQAKVHVFNDSKLVELKSNRDLDTEFKRPPSLERRAITAALGKLGDFSRFLVIDRYQAFCLRQARQAVTRMLQTNPTASQADISRVIRSALEQPAADFSVRISIGASLPMLEQLLAAVPKSKLKTLILYYPRHKVTDEKAWSIPDTLQRIATIFGLAPKPAHIVLDFTHRPQKLRMQPLGDFSQLPWIHSITMTEDNKKPFSAPDTNVGFIPPPELKALTVSIEHRNPLQDLNLRDFHHLQVLSLSNADGLNLADIPLTLQSLDLRFYERPPVGRLDLSRIPLTTLKMARIYSVDFVLSLQLQEFSLTSCFPPAGIIHDHGIRIRFANLEKCTALTTMTLHDVSTIESIHAPASLQVFNAHLLQIDEINLSAVSALQTFKMTGYAPGRLIMPANAQALQTFHTDSRAIVSTTKSLIEQSQVTDVSLLYTTSSEIQQLPPSTTKLEIEGLTEFDAKQWGHLVNLTELHLKKGKGIVALDLASVFPHLKIVTVECDYKLQSLTVPVMVTNLCSSVIPTNVGQLQYLEKFTLSKARGLFSPQHFHSCTRLHELSLDADLREFDSSKFPQLQSLQIRNNKITSLIITGENLVTLDLQCRGLQSLQLDLPSLQNLQLSQDMSNITQLIIKHVAPLRYLQLPPQLLSSAMQKDAKELKQMDAKELRLITARVSSDVFAQVIMPSSSKHSLRHLTVHSSPEHKQPSASPLDFSQHPAITDLASDGSCQISGLPPYLTNFSSHLGAQEPSLATFLEGKEQIVLSDKITTAAQLPKKEAEKKEEIKVAERKKEVGGGSGAHQDDEKKSKAPLPPTIRSVSGPELVNAETMDAEPEVAGWQEMDPYICELKHSGFILKTLRKEPVDPLQYREEILDREVLTAQGVQVTHSTPKQGDFAYFNTPKSKHPPVDIRSTPIEDKDLKDKKLNGCFYATPTLSIRGKKGLISIPGLSPNDRIIMLYLPPNVRGGYNRYIQMGQIDVSQFNGDTITIGYVFKKEKSPPVPPRIPSAEELAEELDPALQQLLDRIIDEGRRRDVPLPENFVGLITELESKSVGSAGKLLTLASYFNCTNNPLMENPEYLTPLTELMEEFHYSLQQWQWSRLPLEETGNCRHRAWNFKCFGDRYVGVPLRVFGNRNHRKIEAFYSGEWRAIDLGGGPAPGAHVSAATVVQAQAERLGGPHRHPLSNPPRIDPSSGPVPTPPSIRELFPRLSSRVLPPPVAQPLVSNHNPSISPKPVSPLPVAQPPMSIPSDAASRHSPDKDSKSTVALARAGESKTTGAAIADADHDDVKLRSAVRTAPNPDADTDLQTLKLFFMHQLQRAVDHYIQPHLATAEKIKLLSRLLDLAGTRVLIQTQDASDAGKIYAALKTIRRKASEIECVTSADELDALNPLPECLVIVWRLFTKKDREFYNTLMNDPPTLNGKPIPATMKLINIFDPDTSMSEALESRCKDRFYWPAHFVLPPIPPLLIPVAERKSDSSQPQIKLYSGACSWRQALLGEKGTLVAAVRSGASSLLLQDPPLDDPDWQSFLFHLKVDGYFHVGSVKYDLPPDFQLLYRHSAPLPAIKTLSMTDLPIATDKKGSGSEPESEPPSPTQTPRLRLIHPLNFEAFFTKTSVKNKRLCPGQQGWMADCKEGGMILIDPKLSLGARQRIVDACADHKFKVQIRLLPSEVPSPLLTSSIDKVEFPSGMTLLATQDQRAAVARLLAVLPKSPATTVLPLHEKLSFGDMIGTIRQIQQEKKQQAAERPVSPFDLPYEEVLHWILGELTAGRNVVLTMPLTEEQYKTLETLTLPNPYLLVNNEIISVTGRLFIVTPPIDYPTPFACLMQRNHRLNDAPQPKIPHDYKEAEDVKQKSYPARMLQLMQQDTIVCIRDASATGKDLTRELDDRKQYPLLQTFMADTEEGMDAWIHAKPKIGSGAEARSIILYVTSQQQWSDAYLQQFSAESRTIYWRGQPVALSPYHKIVMLAHPHDPPLPMAPTITLLQRSDPEIQHDLTHLWNSLSATVNDAKENSLAPAQVQDMLTRMIQAYRHVKAVLPPERGTELDVRQLVIRVWNRIHNALGKPAIKKPIDDHLLNHIIYSACEDQWLGLFGPLRDDQMKVDALKQEWSTLFPVIASELKEKAELDFTGQAALFEKITNQIFIPTSRHQTVKNILENFALALTYPDLVAKTASSIEGSSGIGKSALYLCILNTLEFKMIEPDELIAAMMHVQALPEEKQQEALSQFRAQFAKRFLQINAGDARAATNMQAAAYFKVIVILDELNLDPSCYRSSRYVFTSQNPASFDGRTGVPPELDNQLQKLYSSDYSVAELQEMAGQALQSIPSLPPLDKIVRAFLLAAQEYPSAINARIFFQKLRVCQQHHLVLNPSLTLAQIVQKSRIIIDAIPNPAQVSSCLFGGSAVLGSTPVPIPKASASVAIPANLAVATPPQTAMASLLSLGIAGN